MFDSRTRTIRAAKKRDFVISNEEGKALTLDRHAVIRRYVPGDGTQVVSYFKGPNRNIRNGGGHCLDVHGGVNAENRHIIFWSCHNGANQVWNLQTGGVDFPRYPLADGQGFQIRSRMANNRALYWAENIGSSQHRLRIRTSKPQSNKQWFVFDYRTKSIRALANRNLAIAVVAGGNNWHFDGYDAVVRPFKKDTLMRIRWFDGNVQNIRDLGKRCLDVHGGVNADKRHIIWWSCHNGANQGWLIDQKGADTPKQPLASGVKFQIRSKMADNRALFYAEALDNNQYRLRIQDFNPDDKTQWWVFDARTHTIRAFSKRTYAISNQAGQGFKIDVPVVIRPYSGDNTQKIQWFDGNEKNLRNNGGKCLDVHGGVNDHNRHVIFYECHNGLNQAWIIDQIAVKYPKPVLADGVKFQIRSRMANNRALSFHENMGGDQFRLRIQDHAPVNKNQWFVFDSRTHSIRAFEKRNYAISNEAGYQHRPGRQAVLRPWISEPYQKISFFPGTERNIRNNARLCLDVHGGANENNRHVIFWPCHSGANQGWYVERQGVEFPKYPLANGIRFQIKTLMQSGRVVYIAEKLNKGQRRLRIRDSKPADLHQWWVFDSRTKSVRASGNRNLALSIQFGGNNWSKYDYKAVARPFNREQLQKIRWFPGKVQNIRDIKERCLDVVGASDTNNKELIWYKCHNGLNQAWETVTQAAALPIFPVIDGVKFKIRAANLEGRRTIAWHKDKLVRTSDHNPFAANQWWVFDSRTKTIRTASNKNLALSHQTPTTFGDGAQVHVRPFKNEVDQHITWQEGTSKQLKDAKGFCLDFDSNKNDANVLVKWKACGSAVVTKWILDVNGPIRRKPVFPDGIKFSIRTKLASKKAVYKMNTGLGQNQFFLALRDNHPDEEAQLFVFDSRTNSIRLNNKRDYALSSQIHKEFKFNSWAVVRPWKNEKT